MKKRILVKRLLISVSILLLLAIIYLSFSRNSVTKIKLPDFRVYNFTELDKLSELVGKDIAYNKNVTDLKEAYIITFDLNFKNEGLEYLDYSYFFSNDEESFEQKVDITRKGKLFDHKERLIRDTINYKESRTIFDIKNMLLLFQKSNWIEYFGISAEDHVEFIYIGRVENYKKKIDENIYIIDKNKMNKMESLNLSSIEQNYNMWTIRINNEINYICILN